MSALTPEAVAALPGATASAVAWRARNQLYLTVIAKATFAFVPGGVMARTAPQEILRAEVHHGNNPVRSVRATADTVPYLGRADVLFTGHAHAPPHGLARTLVVRLALADEARCLLDKRLLVQDARGFQRMPIVYERAVAGALGLENPLGVETLEEANVLDPEVPLRPAGFGPIARAWPARKRLLGSTPRKALEAPIAEIPEAFDWAYFQAAPPDQRVDFLRGDEWLLLEGLHPTLPRVQTRLPRARARAWASGLPGAWGRGEPIELNADTLRIDGDEHRCTVVWRRVVPVPSEALLAAVRIVAGVEIEGEPLAPPETARFARMELARAPREVHHSPSGTVVIADAPGAPASRGGAPATARPGEAGEEARGRGARGGGEGSAEPSGTLLLSPDAEVHATQRAAIPFRPAAASGESFAEADIAACTSRSPVLAEADVAISTPRSPAFPRADVMPAKADVAIAKADVAKADVAAPAPSSREHAEECATIIALHVEEGATVPRRVLPFGTLALSPEAETCAAARPSLPFPTGTPASIEARAPATSIPGAPWSGEVAPPAPAPSPGLATLKLEDDPVPTSFDAPPPQDHAGAVSAGASGAVSTGASGAVSAGASGAVSAGASGAVSTDAPGAFSADAAGAFSQDTGYLPASRFYPDLRSAQGIEELPPHALRPLNDGEEVTLERCAIVAVDIVERRVPRAESLKAHGLDEERFRKAEQRWSEAMAQEAKDGGRALRDRYDAASVRAWEAHRGPLQIEEYARLKLAAEQRRLAAALAEMSIRRSLWGRIVRTFDQRLAGNPHLESRFKRELGRLRAAAPGSALPPTGAPRERRAAEGDRRRSMGGAPIQT